MKTKNVGEAKMKFLKLTTLILISLVLFSCIVSEQKSSGSSSKQIENERNFPKVLNSIPKTDVDIRAFVNEFPNATHISISGGYKNVIALEKEDFQSTSIVSISTPPKGESILLQAMSGSKVLGSKEIK